MQEWFLEPEHAAIIRSELNRHFRVSDQTQRQFAAHPSITETGLTEPKLSNFRNRPRSKIRIDQAQAIIAAIGGPSMKGQIQ